ncbi:hypothetical protein CI793_13295 [Anoxybacillus ayderensis]|uniref:Uncharacterized protein n=1 Tax=Anoxybacillus flavithermus TaxID=33934 RepID=A0A178TF14_9BACL|nr:hypothetical protein [Anoxybacillus flavithermus]ASA96859.1 hypothetical protein CA592_08590 [Anoxybacillus flavithermus]MBE2919259.1 hypothetical protein [Anoxybacillus flavithermus]OAO79857.1 hypothetical protein TAF16_1368 [Anoxybacillus flavithermus]THD15337.1 hypothetical protein CI793_13295 [Anoxybacillus ayderensis]
MTAEIAVLNKFGVALAADSAVTIGVRKIYNSANKLFTLSKHHPVGIMVYGNAEFMGIPWETVIKVYRDRLADQDFPTLKEYAEHFIDFIEYNTDYKELLSKHEQDLSNLYFFEMSIRDIKDEIFDKLSQRIQYSDEEIDQPDVEMYLASITESLIEEELDRLSKQDYINNFNDQDYADLKDIYVLKLESIIAEIFEDIHLTQDVIKKLVDVCIFRLLKDFSDNQSGIVIAGFGQSEIFPSLYSYIIDGKVNNKLKYKQNQVATIGEDSFGAAILPFAQSEMVHTFIGGIDPEIEMFSNAYIHDLLKNLPKKYLDAIFNALSLTDSELYNDILDQMKEISNNLFEGYINIVREYKKENNIDPVIAIAANLHKNELAEMAEALVNLTSFKRRVSSSLETVGGPVDVAVITKGDGFIWIRRKHYFNAELNHHFFQKYMRGDKNEQIIKE